MRSNPLGNAWITAKMREFWENEMNDVVKFPPTTEERRARRNRLKVSDLKIITGGAELPDDSPGWLQRMKRGTIFAVASKKQINNFMLLQLQVMYKNNHSVLLYENLTGKPMGLVHPQRFESEFRLVEIIKEFSEEELRIAEQQEEVLTNEQRDWIKGQLQGETGKLEDDESPPKDG